MDLENQGQEPPPLTGGLETSLGDVLPSSRSEELRPSVRLKTHFGTHALIPNPASLYGRKLPLSEVALLPQYIEDTRRSSIPTTAEKQTSYS